LRGTSTSTSRQLQYQLRFLGLIAEPGTSAFEN
jgi:hypothetical protein